MEPCLHCPLCLHGMTNYTISKIFFQTININYIDTCGPGSSVGIATGYGLHGPGIESRWGSRFFAPVQTGPGAHPASCTIGTRSFPGVKRGRGVTLTPQNLRCVARCDAPSHTSLVVQQFLAEKSIPVITQPPHSPDLAPSDFWLFPL